MKEYTIRLGDLLRHLNLANPDTEIIFGAGNLSFYRTKWRGDNLVQVEFNEQTWPLADEQSNAEFEVYKSSLKTTPLTTPEP
jgi:hypothetical protein